MNLLETLERGTLARDLEAELQEVAQQARATGKPGSVSLRISVAAKGAHQIESDTELDVLIGTP
jgi:hypothetical protein